MTMRATSGLRPRSHLLGLRAAFIGACLLVPLLASPGLQARTVEESLAELASSTEFVEITERDGVKLDLRYATARNFTGRNLYGGFRRLYLHGIAAEKLRRAVGILRRSHPGYRLLIFDGLRPRSVQWQLWEAVKGTPKRTYVANPSVGSLHNYGFSVELSIVDDSGQELDMGTAFDDFRPLSQPRYERRFLAEGTLTREQVENRRILRRTMQQAGFRQLSNEWWHFDALPKAEVRRSRRIFE